MKKTALNIDELSIAALRSLSIDAITNAKSGHPGIALGAAPIMYALFKDHLVGDIKDPKWFNRDRFVLSAGHGSALLYSMLHVAGYDISMEDMKKFRQLGSKTPGHPEVTDVPGVDATSGPLGQGIATAVGMAMAEQAVGAQNKDGYKLCSHFTYCLCGDGCLEEGISQEAISFAGKQELNKLVLLYDSNNVTLDGPLGLSSSEYQKLRFLAANWNVLEVSNGNDYRQISKAISKAKHSLNHPTLIIVTTVIGFGSPSQGTCKVHGSPLSVEDAKKTKEEVYNYHYPEFTVPQEVYDLFKKTFAERGKSIHDAWNKYVSSYEKRRPEDYKLFMKALSGDCSGFTSEDLPKFEDNLVEATRTTSGKVINEIHKSVPFVMGGCADVAGSVMTKIEGGINFEPSSREGRNINFGIREFAMAAIQNGMLLHGGVRTYVGCFLVFSDYMKAAIRMAALSKLPAIYLFSHDTIAVGEDGPTHQPIEQLVMLRSIPGVTVIRPCDARETYCAWKYALSVKDHPVAIILSRQGLPLNSLTSLAGLKKGAYIVSPEQAELKETIIATGSEVSLAIKAKELLGDKGKAIRVLSVPSVEILLSQNEQYQKEIIGVKRDQVVVIEMLSTFGWYRFADTVIGIDTFGASGKAGDVMTKFGFTPENIAKTLAEKL